MRSELVKRLISALFLGIVVLAITWYGGLAFRVLLALAALLIFYEWSSIVAVASGPGRIVAFGWLAVAASMLALIAGQPLLAFGIGLAGGILAGLWGLAALRTVWAGLGVFYAVLPVLALAQIRGGTVLPGLAFGRELDVEAAGFVSVVFVLVVVWATDVAAYFAGRRFGGPKLAARISPSKTWSGAIGGAVGGVVGGMLVVAVAEAGDPLRSAGLALCLSIFSQFGDLAESWVKRRFGVKDSGHLIPGHGGLMDRVDGLVFAAFAAYLIAALMAGAGGAADTAAAGGKRLERPVAGRPALAAVLPAQHLGGVGPWT